jgi:hypothetical protein
VPYALPAVYLDISSAEAQLGQVHATIDPSQSSSDKGVTLIHTQSLINSITKCEIRGILWKFDNL